MTRRKFTSEYKTKVVIESLKERSTLSELARKYKISPQQISTWKREFLDKAEGVFNGVKKKSKQSEHDEEKDALLKIIGQQKVEIDFLKKALT